MYHFENADTRSVVRKRFRFRPIYISFLVIIAGAAAYLTGIPFLELMELKTIDLRFASRGAVSPGTDVVLAVIHEKSLAAEGKWPWPRSKIADLVSKLSSAGATVIAFDIVFSEPDNQRLLEVLGNIQRTFRHLNLQNNRVESYIRELKKQSDTDQRLADSIRRASSKVVTGYFFHTDKQSAKHMDAAMLPVHEKNIRASMYKLVRYSSANARHVALLKAFAPQSSISSISNASEYAGFFNMVPDPDGVIRRMPAVIRFKDALYAPLSLMAVSAYLDAPISITITEYGVESIRIGNLKIPADELGRVLINYRGGEKTFPHIPVTDILQGKISSSVFKDKIVLVGVTATGIYDLRVTPFATVFPGLEIHANLIDTVLSRDFLQQPQWAAGFDLLSMIVAGLLLGIILQRVGVIAGALTGLATFFGYIFVCLYFFSEKGWILNMVYPLTVVVAIYIGITAFRYVVEAKEKRFIRSAFSTYLAPSVVKQLIESPEKLVLGGEQRIITAFFSDVQQFTRICENLSPREIVELLNEFLTEMTNIILRYEGTVDKFEGDAIIAFFGAPNELDHHAEVACKASIDMQNRLAEMCEVWKALNKPELKMRIGLSTGPAVVGNMGSRNRMDYTMMGDTVNIAARLEGVNKAYGTYNLISESTYRELNGDILTREIDSVTVVGKENPVTIYEVLGYSQNIDGPIKETLLHYQQGLAAYRIKQWDNAISHFQSALAAMPHDGPSKTMLERCRAFMISPPGEDWDGTFTLTSK
ncbi:MAG: CHASE2 domain-containing protein [Deltaproteobacteria bacterium]|nr:CHASE2 domain-containing protein [Deltaproteobacteria bacterium]